MQKKGLIFAVIAVVAVAAVVAGMTLLPNTYASNDKNNAANTIPEANSTLEVLTPVASGTLAFNEKDVVLDASNSAQGYVMLKYTGSSPKVKVQITKKGGTTYTYNILKRDDYEVFPMSEGDGSYDVKLFENVEGTKYAQKFAKTVDVKLDNKFLPFLYPNQYVNFTAQSQVIAMGDQLTKNAKTDFEKVEIIYNYAVDNFTYDYDKAATVKSGYLPKVDEILQSKTGICFDYAAVMSSMLRGENIPCKLVVGYTGKIYHAWINVYTESTGWIDGLIFFDGQNWQMMDPTFASSNDKSKEILEYISTPSNYTAKYCY